MVANFSESFILTEMSSKRTFVSDMKDFGMYAMESMRLEKSYRGWKSDLDHEYSPLRSGLNRFVDLDKSDFIGKSALVAESAKPLLDVFATFILDPVSDSDLISSTDALYGCPVFSNDDNVGYITSGGFGHRISSGIALGYVKPEYAVAGTAVTINVLGILRAATVVDESPYDTENKALRS